MARKLLTPMVIVFWALMTSLFIKEHLFIATEGSRPPSNALLDPEYLMGVYYGKERIGEFRSNSFPETEDSTKRFRNVTSLRLNYPAVGEAQITGESFADEKLNLRSFHYRLKCKLNMLEEQDATLDGKVEDGKLLLNVKWGSFQRSLQVPCEDGISLYDPITPWILGDKFQPGHEYTVKVFNRLTRKPQLAKVKVLGRKNIQFQGETIPGCEVEAVVEDLKSTFVIGHDRKIYRMESPFGFSLVREPFVPSENKVP
jgi:hypothetical protein